MKRLLVDDVEVFELEALPEKRSLSVREGNQYLIAMCCTTMLLEIGVALAFVGTPSDSTNETGTPVVTNEIITLQIEP